MAIGYYNKQPKDIDMKIEIDVEQFTQDIKAGKSVGGSNEGTVQKSVSIG